MQMGDSSIFYRDAGKTEEAAVAMAGEDEMGEEKLRAGWGARGISSEQGGRLSPPFLF